MTATIDRLSTQLQETGQGYAYYPKQDSDVRETIAMVEAAADQIGAEVTITRGGANCLRVTVV